MSNQQFDALIQETQAKVRESQSQIESLTSRIEAARAKIGTAEADIDIENATLEDVHAHTEVMNANIAELIMGLDDVTNAFSKDFDEMRSKTGWESFVGVFSKGKSESMRQERMRTANIDDKLQDLIAKSDVIVKLLEGQLAVLEEQREKVEDQPDRHAGRPRGDCCRSWRRCGRDPQGMDPDHRAGEQDQRRTGRRRAHPAGDRIGRTEQAIQRQGSGRAGQAGQDLRRWSAISKRAKPGSIHCRTRRRRRWC